MDVRCRFQVKGTVVDNEFIDHYMAAANGEYVKVYLYLLRHQQDALNISGIADALNHTEADVRRALAYWEKLGTLKLDGSSKGDSAPQQGYMAEGGWSGSPAAAQAEAAVSAAGRKTYSQEQVNRLSEDEDFTQLLYIAQKYMNKVFTQRECEVFAYLYDGLKMSAELLEYLVEYCVQGGHTSIRYIETVGLNWHEKGLQTVDAAKAYASGFTKDSFAVMRAFGLTDRKPGSAEKEMIERWFGAYGFSREVVLEACNRTLTATHSPSFRYADKILSEWKKAGVRTLSDIGALDQKRQGSKNERTAKRPANQFHNFEQRNTDYDSMVLDQVKSWINEA